jgi:hypothetical protein
MQLKIRVRDLNGEIRKGGGYKIARFNTLYAVWETFILLVQFIILGD